MMASQAGENGKPKASSKFSDDVLRPGDPMDEWDRFVDQSPQGSVYCRAWWLEAVAPGQYEILVLREGGRIVAGMPLVTRREYGLDHVYMPRQTQTFGLLLPAPTGSNYEKTLTREMALQTEVVRALPPFATFQMRFHYSYTNWLPFYWAGYRAVTHYTYVIEDLTDLDAVFARLGKNKRGDVRRAQRHVTVHEDLDPDEFYSCHVTTMEKLGKKISYTRQLFRRICEGGYANHNAKTWYAIDAEGNMHAALYVCFDNHASNWLIMPVDPDFRKSGAGTLLIWTSIEHAARHCERYDYEGSTIPGVEASVRKMAGVQKPYFVITKDNRSFTDKAFAKIVRTAQRNLQKVRIFRPKVPFA